MRIVVLVAAYGPEYLSLEKRRRRTPLLVVVNLRTRTAVRVLSTAERRYR